MRKIKIDNRDIVVNKKLKRKDLSDPSIYVSTGVTNDVLNSKLV